MVNYSIINALQGEVFPGKWFSFGDNTSENWGLASFGGYKYLKVTFFKKNILL